MSEKGYTKEKADKLIKQHEDNARRLEEEAKDLANYATFDQRNVDDLTQQAEQERRKADNLRELETQWGDTPPESNG
jgi:hypothetical protein